MKQEVGQPPFRVRATRRLFYGQTRRSGDVFDLRSVDEYSSTCMSWVEGTTPLQTSTPQSVVDAESPVTARNRVRNRLMPATEADDGQVVHDFDPFE